MVCLGTLEPIVGIRDWVVGYDESNGRLVGRFRDIVGIVVAARRRVELTDGFQAVAGLWLVLQDEGIDAF